MQVNIVDSLMGAGKTSAMINYINASDKDTRFLYITPYLSEVERIIKQCPYKTFKQPERRGSKTRGIKELFERGVNIVSTHALLGKFNEEIIDLAYDANYILVMDEVADVVAKLPISNDDLAIIRKNYTVIENGHLLRWTARDYEGKLEEYKNLCDLGCVGVYGDTTILWLFPITTFKGFREIYILTYMFEAQVQKYYFDFYGINYKQMYVTKSEVDTEDGMPHYMLTDIPQRYDYSNYGSLIMVHEGIKLNQIGELDNSLSKSWYKRNKSNKLMATLKKNMVNYFQHYTGTQSKQNMWTTFKDYQNDIRGKGYSKGFVSSNMRATNDFKDRTAVAYPINKFFNPYIKNFFAQHEIEIDEDAYALSEMIQWIFRSAIRQGMPIQIYVPSFRMRELLKKWLQDICAKSGGGAIDS